MATSIARLAVDFVANTASFSKGIKKAQSDLSKFSSSVSAASRKLIGYGSVLTGVATGGGLGLLLTQQSEAIDVMSKFSKQTGIATEALVGFQTVADLSGVDSETLNKGISKLAVQLGRVRQGASGAAAPFERLGLNAKQLSAMPIGRAMELIADRINALPTPADRAAAAFAIFGKAGTQMLPFLANGSKGLREAADEAKRFGLSFSGIDGTKVEEMNDAWTRTKNLFIGIGRQIVINIAPAVQAALSAFTSWATEGGDIATTVKNGVMKAVEWIDFLAARAKVGFLSIKLVGQLAWATILNAAEGAVKGMGKLLNYVTKEIKRVVDGVNKVSGMVGIKPIDFTATSYDTNQIDMGGKASADAAINTASQLREAAMNADSVGFKAWFEKTTETANKAAAAASVKGTFFDPDEMADAEKSLAKNNAQMEKLGAGATDTARSAESAGSAIKNTGTFGQGSAATVAFGRAGGGIRRNTNPNVRAVQVNGLTKGANDTQQAMILRQILFAIQRGNYPGRTNAAYAG